MEVMEAQHTDEPRTEEKESILGVTKLVLPLNLEFEILSFLQGEMDPVHYHTASKQSKMSYPCPLRRAKSVFNPDFIVKMNRMERRSFLKQTGSQFGSGWLTYDKHTHNRATAVEINSEFGMPDSAIVLKFIHILQGIRKFSVVDRVDFANDYYFATQLAKLPCLTHICFSDCFSLLPIGFQLMNGFPTQIEEISIVKCEPMDKTSLIDIIRNSPVLQIFAWDSNAAFDDLRGIEFKSKHLKSVSITNCGLNNIDCIANCFMFGTDVTLRLDFSNNGITSITNIVSWPSRLTELNLKGNRLSKAGVFGVDLSNYKFLVKVDLTKNSALSGNGDVWSDLGMRVQPTCDVSRDAYRVTTASVSSVSGVATASSGYYGGGSWIDGTRRHYGW